LRSVPLWLWGIFRARSGFQPLMPNQPKPKNVAKYQDTEQFSGRPDVAHADDRVRHDDKADCNEFAEANADENEGNLSQPAKEAPLSVPPGTPVTHSKTRKSDEDVGGF
jgi:hypothetical protein